MTAAEIPAELAGYLEELVRRLAAVAELDAAYLFGSAALGAYEHGRSDVDVIAVTARPSSRATREALAAAAESLPCPARKLELVVYARGAERHEVNVNTGELAHFDPGDWQEREDPLGGGSVLNSLRAWMWLDTGRWGTKPDAARWLRERVRARIAGARA